MKELTFETLSPEQIQSHIDYITMIMEYSFEEIDNLARTSKDHCDHVVKFFSIKPHIQLHKQFEEKFCKPSTLLSQKIKEWKLLWLMKQNKNLFIKEHLIDAYQYDDVKYQIIDRYYLIEKSYTINEEKYDDTIQISIPYFSSSAQRDKFWYWLVIKKSECPEFFDTLVEKMKKYEWNAALTSNKR